MDGVEGTLYEGEHFQLLFKFNNKYPFDSPGKIYWISIEWWKSNNNDLSFHWLKTEVTFIGPNIPVHPHVYSNGHICLSILTEDW